MTNRGTSLFAVALMCLAASACGGQAVSTTPTGAAAPGKTEQVKIVNQPGLVVAMDTVLVPGRVTVIEFYADWCGACKIVEKQLLTAIDGEPRIVVRKINIKDDTSAVAKQYDVGTLPHVRIFDRAGKLAHVLVGNNATKAGVLARQLLPRE